MKSLCVSLADECSVHDINKNILLLLNCFQELEHSSMVLVTSVQIHQVGQFFFNP